ncbi:MAG TPA: hypothetical protein VK914_13030 [bacterium]|nr:hypothetical protein [bacterium]
MRILTGMLIFAATLSAATGTLHAAPQFIHTPVLAAPAGEDIDIQAALLGADTLGNVQVRLYFRPRGVEIYRSVTMGGAFSGLDASIPAAQVDTVGVEYYIEADSFSGGSKTVVATYPVSNAELNPVEVVVRKDTSAPVVTILSPASGEAVDSSIPVVSAAFNDPAGSIDLSTVVVKLDGQARTDGLEVYDTIVTYIPPAALSDGPHTVTILVTNKAGHTGSATWSFVVGASASENMGPPHQAWVVDGSLALETQYGDVLKQPTYQTTGLPFRPYGANQGWFNVNARGADDTFSLKVYDTDENRSDQQPLDRYTGTWSNREGQISVGDVSPSFSELSMYDLYELRGLDFNLVSGDPNGGHTRFDGVWGETQTAVNPGAPNLTNSISFPTYAQYLYGARWEAGNPYFQLGLNSVTINDDDTSLSSTAGVEPEYNTVLTSDVRIGLPFAWLSLNGEGGVSYFAADETLFGVSLGSAYKAAAVWDAKPLGSKLSFDWMDLGGGFGLLPGEFSTMANPGLQSDYRGFESAFNQALFDGKFNFSLAENNWHDNLDSSKLVTTTTNYLSAMTAVAPSPTLPYLNLGYTQTNIYNNGSLELVDADGNTLAQYTNQLTAVYNAAVGYTRALDSLSTGSLNLSYVGTDLTDMAPIRSVQNIESWDAVLAAFYARGSTSFSGTLGLGGSTDPAGYDEVDSVLDPTNNSSSLSASLRWNQQWWASPYSSYLGWDLVQTDSNTDAGATSSLGTLGSQIMDNTRDTFSLGGTYKLSQVQKLALQLSYSLVNAEVASGVSGTATEDDSLTELYADLRYDLTF